MRNFKLLLLSVSLLTSFSVLAQNSSRPETPEETVKSITSPKKKEIRKKKATMCEECGKPETECECDHAKDEKKKDKVSN